MDGFVHTAEGYAKYCASSPELAPATSPTRPASAPWATTTRIPELLLLHGIAVRGVRPLVLAGCEPRAFPIASRRSPEARRRGWYTIRENDHLPQLNINNIFQELQNAGVSWKIYYTVTDGGCLGGSECGSGGDATYPPPRSRILSYSVPIPLRESQSRGVYRRRRKPSRWWATPSNSFCIDPNHIAPLSQYYTDLKNDTLPASRSSKPVRA